MPKNKQGAARRKKRVHMLKDSPFPIPISPSSSSGEPTGLWFYYTGYIEGSAVVVKHSGDMDFLYRMGFFGKGTLSRSQPNFYERSHKARIELPKKDGHHKVVQAVVTNKRSYLVHRRYKALADGRTKEYSDIVRHEEQQQGFIDSTDDEIDDDDNSDESVSADTEQKEAYHLLNSQNANRDEQEESSTAVLDNSISKARIISGKVRSHLVSMLSEVAALSNEQITTFLIVPQDLKQLTEKYKKMRSAEVSKLNQMYAAQFPGRNFREGEVITLDEDDSTADSKHSENETDNAVVISDSDDLDEEDKGASKTKKIRRNNEGTMFLSQKKGVSKETLKDSFVVSSSTKDFADWASDDSNFWDDDTKIGDKSETTVQVTSEKLNVQKKGLKVIDNVEEIVNSSLEQDALLKEVEGIAEGSGKDKVDETNEKADEKKEEIGEKKESIDETNEKGEEKNEKADEKKEGTDEKKEEIGEKKEKEDEKKEEIVEKKESIDEKKEKCILSISSADAEKVKRIEHAMLDDSSVEINHHNNIGSDGNTAKDSNHTEDIKHSLLVSVDNNVISEPLSENVLENFQNDRGIDDNNKQHTEVSELDTLHEMSADGPVEMLTTSLEDKSSVLSSESSLEMDSKKDEATSLSSAEILDDSEAIQQQVDVLSQVCEDTTDNNCVFDTVKPVDAKLKICDDSTSNNFQDLAKNNKVFHDTASDLENYEPFEKKINSPSLLVDTGTDVSVTNTVNSATHNDKVSSHTDDGITNIDSDNSNDSDDVICIESKSAEPKKVAQLSVTVYQKPSIPIITKSVTFTSSITPEPTFVTASVGFITWGPVLHFNFTGDPSHLPTVMSVSLSSPPLDENRSLNKQPQNSSNAVYERIYPPIRSLIANPNSAGAIIKQRLKGLPCLTTSYLKVSQRQEVSMPSSSNGIRHTKHIQEAPTARPTQSTLKPYIIMEKQQPHVVSSSQSSKKSHISDTLQPSSSTDTHKLTLSHIVSYMRACKSIEISTVSDNGHTEIHPKEKTGNICKTTPLLATLSTITNKLEQLYNIAFPKDKHIVDEDRVKFKAESGNLLSKFNMAISRYITSIDVSRLAEPRLLTMLLSKTGENLEISDVVLSEVRTNMSAFQIWLLEKRLEHLERNQPLQSCNDLQKTVIVDLTENTDCKEIVPHSNFEMGDVTANTECVLQPDCEMVDLEVNSVNKISVPQSDCEMDVDLASKSDHKVNVSLPQSDSEIVNLAENSEKKLNENLLDVENTENINGNLPKEITDVEAISSERGQKTLETENRKRRFDRSEELLDESRKKVKTNKDEFTEPNQVDDEKQLNSCRRENLTLSKNEDLMNEGDYSSVQLEDDAEKLLDDETSNSDKSVSEKLVQDSYQKDNIESNTSLDDVKHDHVLLNTNNLQNDSTEDSCQIDINDSKCSEKMSTKEAKECLKDEQLNSDVDNTDLVSSVQVDCPPIELSTETNSLVQSQQTLEDSGEDNLMEDSSSLPRSSSFEDKTESSAALKDESLEDISDVVSSKLKHQRPSEMSNNVSTVNTASKNIYPTLEETPSKHLLESEKQHSGMTVNCVDSSELECVNITHDNISQSEITSDSSNLDLKLNLNGNDVTAGKDKSTTAGSSTDFQIFIGSSSDEREEPDRKKQKPSQSVNGLHPYSINDDSDGHLFVVPNTSDEDYEDDYNDESGVQVGKRQQQKWRPCLKRDPYATEERLHLMLEEAFFLSFGLGCLNILDPEMKRLNLTQMWQQYQTLKEQFVGHYVAYHYFRSQGWVPKSGLKFGCDFILYRDGPPFFHGSYSVVVIVVKDSTLLPMNRNGGISFDHRKLNWVSLAGLNRITEHVAKELMLCYVIWPGDLSYEESLSPDCISRFKVKEVVVSRWVSSQERENRLEGDEEIP